MLLFYFLIFVAIFLPPFMALFFLVRLIKLLVMDKTEAKRTRRKERAIRSVILMAVSLFIWYCLSRDEELSMIIGPGMEGFFVLLLIGLFLFVIPAALIVLFCMALHRFRHADKEDTKLYHSHKIWLIVVSCLTWTVVPAEVLLIYIPMMDMPLM